MEPRFCGDAATRRKPQQRLVAPEFLDLTAALFANRHSWLAKQTREGVGCVSHVVEAHGLDASSEALQIETLPVIDLKGRVRVRAHMGSC